MGRRIFFISLCVLGIEILFINIYILFVPRYNIKFSDPSIANVKVVKGKKVAEPQKPSKKNLTFVEWQLNGEKYNFDSRVYGDLELVAIWEDNDGQNVQTITKTIAKQNVEDENSKVYTVTIDSNGGSYISPIYVKSGETLPSNIQPEKSGYRFNGWDLNGKHFDNNTIINSDITIKALWIKSNQITITFIRNFYLWDNYPDIIGSLTVNYNDKITSEMVDQACNYQNKVLTTEDGSSIPCSSLTYCDANTPFDFDTNMDHDIKLCFTCK